MRKSPTYKEFENIMIKIEPDTFAGYSSSDGS